MKKIKGFTLVEISVAIVIFGLILTFALPRYYKLVQYTYSKEVFDTAILMHKSLMRCYMMQTELIASNVYLSSICTDPDSNQEIKELISNPEAHFSYTNTAKPDQFFMGSSIENHKITATRNARDGGDGLSTIVVTYYPTGNNYMEKSGTGVFQGLK